MTSTTVIHEGRETGYHLETGGGEGGTILCVHGPGATRRVWDRQRTLSDVRPIAFLDLSGRESSTDINAAVGWETLSAYTSDVAAVARSIDASVLVGHSLGALVSIHAITSRNVPVTGLVAIGAGIRLPIAEHMLSMTASDRDAFLDYLLEPGRLVCDPKPAVANRVKADVRACPSHVIERDYHTCQRVDAQADVRELDPPILVMCGEHDKMTPPEACANLAREAPQGRFTSVKQAAHVPMMERPVAVNDILRAFLADPQAYVTATS